MTDVVRNDASVVATADDDSIIEDSLKTVDPEQRAAEYCEEFLRDYESGEVREVLKRNDDSDKFHAYRYLDSLKRMMEW